MTEVANALFTSQPGVSRQIRELEDELGVVIFERNGKRLTGLTEPGKGILKIVDRLLIEAENLQQASLEYSGQTSGTVSVAATHTQARYALPKVVQGFRAAFPEVRIALQQSAPEHIAEWVLSGKTDIGIATFQRPLFTLGREPLEHLHEIPPEQFWTLRALDVYQIGRASCRERV